MNVEIAHLCECPEHLATVARWIHQEWWSNKPGHTVETMATRLREARDRNATPLSLVTPEHRGHGVGSDLVRALVREAAQLRVRRLYLGTDIPQYYARLGAVMHEEVSDDYRIMSIKTGVQRGYEP